MLRAFAIKTYNAQYFNEQTTRQRNLLCLLAIYAGEPDDYSLDQGIIKRRW